MKKQIKITLDDEGMRLEVIGGPSMYELLGALERAKLIAWDSYKQMAEEDKEEVQNEHP